jgi:hypothetical protein
MSYLPVGDLRAWLRECNALTFLSRHSNQSVNVFVTEAGASIIMDYFRPIELNVGHLSVLVHATTIEIVCF